MTKKEVIKVIEIIEKRFITLDKEELQALDMAIKALENEPRFLVHSDGKIEQIIEPCDDCVSRQALLEFFKDDDYVVNEINNMPSVLPKREQGKWITQYHVAHQKEYIYCSECREEFSYDGETGIKMSDYKHCPNCGAEMR